MPIFLLIAALFVPRLVIAGLWFFSNWFSGVFDSILWPVIGFIFAPFTLLWYTFVILTWGDWGAFQVVVLVVAILLDLSPARKRKK